MQTEAEEKLRDLETALHLQLQQKEQELDMKEEEAREAKSQLLTFQRDQRASSDANKKCEELAAKVDDKKANPCLISLML